MMSMMPSALSRQDSNLDTVLTLPQGAGSIEIADACRAAALAFLNESQRWGKAELAMWLMGPYGQLTQYLSPFSRRRTNDYAGSVPLLREIDARMVDRVIAAAHEEVTAALVQMSEPEGAATFAFTMLASGFVARCEDHGHVAGWVPTSAASRLADRVLSLLAADYLARPEAYESELAVCSHCRVVAFDAYAQARGICSQHGNSMFVARLRSSTPSYFPEGA